MGAFRAQIQVALTAPVTVAMDSTAANAISHQLAIKTGIDESKLSAAFVGQVDVVAASEYATAAATLAATPSPPQAPAVSPNGCLADGSQDVCDVWPSELDTSLFGVGKYNYFYDGDDSFHRLGSRDPIFTPDQFKDNGICTCTSARTLTLTLYLVAAILTRLEGNPLLPQLDKLASKWTNCIAPLTAALGHTTLLYLHIATQLQSSAFSEAY